MQSIGKVVTEAPKSSEYSLLPEYLKKLLDVRYTDMQPNYRDIGLEKIPTFLLFSRKLVKSAKFAVKENLWDISNQLYENTTHHIWQWMHLLYQKDIPQKTEFDLQRIIEKDAYTAKLICRFIAKNLSVLIEHIFYVFSIFLQRVTEASLGVLETQAKTPANFLLLLWSDKMQHAIYDKNKFQTEAQDFAIAMANLLKKQTKTDKWKESILLKQLDAMGVFKDMLNVYVDAVYEWLPSVLTEFQDFEVLAAWYDRLTFAAPMISEIQPFLVENCQVAISKIENNSSLNQFVDNIHKNMKIAPNLSISDYEFLVDCLTALYDEKNIPDEAKIAALLYEQTGYDPESLNLILYGIRDLHVWNPPHKNNSEHIGVDLSDVEVATNQIVLQLRFQREALLEWEGKNGIDRAEQESYGIKLVEMYVQNNYKELDGPDNWKTDKNLLRQRDSYLKAFKVEAYDSQDEETRKDEQFSTFVELIVNIKKAEMELNNLERKRRALEPTRTRTRALIEEEAQLVKHDILTVLKQINTDRFKNANFELFREWILNDGGFNFFKANLLETFKKEIERFNFPKSLSDERLIRLMLQMGELYRLKQKGDALSAEYEKFMDKRSKYTIIYFLVIVLLTGYIFNVMYNLIPEIVPAAGAGISIVGGVQFLAETAMDFIYEDGSKMVYNSISKVFAAVTGGATLDLTVLSPASIVKSLFTGNIGIMEFIVFYLTSVTPVVINLVALTFIVMLAGARFLTDVTTETWSGNLSAHYADAQLLIQPRLRSLGIAYSSLVSALQARNDLILRATVASVPLMSLGPVGLVAGAVGVYGATHRPNLQTMRFVQNAQQYLRGRTTESFTQAPNTDTEEQDVNDLINSGKPRVEVIDDETKLALNNYDFSDFE